VVKGGPIYLVKDLARLSGLSIHTVKYYLRRGLIREVGRSPETNYRYFDETTLDHLSKICDMRRGGRSLQEIQENLPTLS
jgi:MerR family transcriptional regulator, aldehyde-responsive regulator